MSFNAGNSVAERQNRAKFGEAGYSIIKRRALAKKVRWMPPEDERRAIEAFIEKHGVKKIVLEPPPNPPRPPPARTGPFLRWRSPGEDNVLRGLLKAGYNTREISEKMNRSRDAIRKHAQQLGLELPHAGRPRKT